MDEFDYKLQQALAKRKAAQDVMGSFRSPEASMVSGHYVRPSFGDTLAQGLRSYNAMKEAEKADAEIPALLQQRTEGTQKALAEFLRQSQGTPANAPQDGVGPTLPAQAPNMQGAYGALMQAPDAGLRQMGMQGMAQIPQMEMQQKQREEERAFRQQEAQLAREARAAELQARAEDQRISQQERLQAQRELQQMQIEAQKEMRAMQLAGQRETRQLMAGDRNKPPAGYRWKADGSLEAIPGDPAAVGGAGGGNATEGERKAATLLQRMQGSEAQLEEALKKDKGAEKPGLIASGLSKMGLDVAANIATPENRQKVEAAQLDILDAALTLGTGAAYTKEQLEGYRKSYFPQIGDKPNTIKDKQDRLNNILNAARIAAGRAGGQVTAPTPPSATPQAPKRLKFDAQGNLVP